MQEVPQFTNEEISVREVFDRLKSLIVFLKSKWITILIATIFGAFVGIVYAFSYPFTYSAKTTFVVEEVKAGNGLSGLASLAGQFGLDIGSNTGGGLISGDNILLYFKSESLIRSVLLSPWDNKLTFADKYIQIYKIDKEEPHKSLLKIGINYNDKNYSREQDSILQVISQRIIKSELYINRIDKKAGFIELISTMRNEEFAKRFNEQIVQTAIDQYIDLKTERQKKTVQKLQERVDSISGLLNSKTSSSAFLQTQLSTMDVNPLYKTSSTIKSELTMRDKAMLGSIYVEVVKNLEMAKFTLSQETPVIQIVNKPIYPLTKNKLSKLKAAIIVGFLCFIFTILVLLYRKKLKSKVLCY